MFPGKTVAFVARLLGLTIFKIEPPYGVYSPDGNLIKSDANSPSWLEMVNVSVSGLIL